MSTTIVEQIQELRQMTVNQLREKYEEVFGESSNARNKDYLWKRIAWKIQELQYGGLSERAKRRAEEIADEHDIRMRPPREVLKEFDRSSKPVPRRNKRLPTVGTILTKEYKGETIGVEVLTKGFRFKGRVFNSLSAIAREITGTHWNGWHFFNLKGNGNA